MKYSLGRGDLLIVMFLVLLASSRLAIAAPIRESPCHRPASTTDIPYLW